MSYVLNRGFGATTGQYVAQGQAVASSGVALAASAGSLAPMAAAIGVSVPVLGALIGIGILGVGAAINAIANSGCGPTCIASSNFANNAEKPMVDNIRAYFALPAPRSRAAQQVALANFDRYWQWLTAQCGNPQLGDAGKRCITDRQAGACTWDQPANKVPAWGTPAAGECWNWFNGYRDPIANDPNVTDALPASASASDVSGTLSAVLGGSGDTPGWLPLAAVAGLLAVAVLS